MKLKALITFSLIVGSFPDYRRFDHDFEQWEFIKADQLMGTRTIILVDFDNDRVVNMDSFDGNSNPTPVPPLAICPPKDMDYDRPLPPTHNHGRPGRSMNERDFKELYNKVKAKPFKDDQLELLAPHIVDRENYEEIIGSLSFLSSEEKVHKIFSGSRR